MKAWLKKLVAFFFVYSEIRIAGVLYMRRWRFMPDWLPGFCVHNILQSDDDRALHDHPFYFLTYIQELFPRTYELFVAKLDFKLPTVVSR